MYKNFKEKNIKSVYLPIELIEAIQHQANNSFSSFNKIVVEVLIKEFLLLKNKAD